jgi:hypothetical protein
MGARAVAAVYYRRRRECRQAIKRGMIRYVFLCIDLSKGMSENDMRPNRLTVTTKVGARDSATCTNACRRTEST